MDGQHNGNDNADTLNQILSAGEVPFDSLGQSFDAAKISRVERIELKVCFAGFPVAITIVGSRWAAMVADAVGHLPQPKPGIAPVLTIEAWDIEETGIQPNVSMADPEGPPTVMKTSQDGLYIGEERHHGSCWLNRSASHIVACIHSVHDLTLDARARPFHKLLSAWLLDKQVQFVHAGLVCNDNHAMLFVGNGGAGKSTASIACLRGGLGYLGDDFVGISKDDLGFTGHGFYASCLLDSKHLQRFPDLTAYAQPPNLSEEFKHVLFLQKQFAPALQHTRKIGAIALPRVVDGAHSSFERASMVEALTAIAPTSVMYLPRPSKQAFETLASLVQAVPAYWFNSGQNVDGIAPVVNSFLNELG